MAKELLRSNTEKALESGAFGLPWFQAIDRYGISETFWGFDHIGQVVDHLGFNMLMSEAQWRLML